MDQGSTGTAGETIDLSGDRVRLRSMVSGDRNALVAIRSTAEVRARWRGDNLVAEFDDDLADDETSRLTILAPDGTIVGLIQFAEEEDPEYFHASLDIYIDPSAHRRGFATDAIRTLIAHLFDERGHHRLIIDPAADNHAAIACYAGVGFEPVGIMRQYERQADGIWADGLLMELVRSASDRR